MARAMTRRRGTSPERAAAQGSGGPRENTAVGFGCGIARTGTRYRATGDRRPRPVAAPPLSPSALYAPAVRNEPTPRAHPSPRLPDRARRRRVVGVASRTRPSCPAAARRSPGSAPALGLYALATLLRGERWHRILALRATWRRARGDCYALTTVGYMGNNVLPARAGEALRVVLLSGRTDASKRTLLGSVVAERLLDVIALGVIFVVVRLRRARRDACCPPTGRCWWPASPSWCSLRAAWRSGCCAATTSSSACATGCARWPTRRARCSRREGDPAAGRHLRALGGRGRRLPGRRPVGRPRHQHDRRPLPRGAHQLRRRAARRARLDRHLRRRGGLGRQPARRAPARPRCPTCSCCASCSTSRSRWSASSCSSPATAAGRACARRCGSTPAPRRRPRLSAAADAAPRAAQLRTPRAEARRPRRPRGQRPARSRAGAARGRRHAGGRPTRERSHARR